MSFQVVHIDPLHDDHTIEEEELARADARLAWKMCRTDDEVIELARDADAILCTYYRTGRNILEACPKAKTVVRYGIGFDNVDLKAATDHGILVCNVPDYCIEEVANHTMAMILACNRKLVRHDRAIRTIQREPLAGVGPLRGETLGLVALGNIGRAVAVRAKAFGLNVIASDPYLDSELAKRAGVPLVSLHEVLAQSDYVSLHVPLNDETRGMIGARELALLKPTAYLVTTCRGGVVSESALHDALEKGAIAGAAVDVWEDEHGLGPEHPLLRFDTVIATPHVAYYSDQSGQTLRRRVGEAAADVLLGFEPRSVVNREVLSKVSLKPRRDR